MNYLALMYNQSLWFDLNYRNRLGSFESHFQNYYQEIIIMV